MKTSRISSLLLLLAGIPLLLLFVESLGAVADEEQRPSGGDHVVHLPVVASPVQAIIPDTTVVLGDETMATLVEAAEDLSVLTFGEMTPELAQVAAGDVIVGGPSEALPFGFLRGVTGVATSGNGVTLQTEAAALTDSIMQGEISWQQTFTAADVIAVSAAPDVIVHRATGGGENGAFYITIPALGDTCVNLGGSVSVPQFHVDYDLVIESWQLESMRFLVTEQVVNELGLELVCEGSRDVEWTLAQFYLTPIVVFVGFVPVVFLPKLDLVLGVEGTLKAGLSYDVSLDVTTVAGAVYEDGSFETVGEFRPVVEGTLSPVVGASVQAYAGPELSLLTYGLAGPYLQNVIYAEAEVLADVEPWWTLYWGLEAPIGVELEIVGRDLADWEAVAIGYRDVIASAGDGEEQVSTFDGTSLDGWTLYLGTLENPGSGGSGGGEGNGYLYTSPPGESRTSYFVAPEAYHRDWGHYSELRFDLWSAGGSSYSSGYQMYGDVFLANGELTAELLLPARPGETWESFTVALDDSENWTLGGGATSIGEVLANVTDFQIRAEYGVGNDETGLDNVVLGQGAGTLPGPVAPRH